MTQLRLGDATSAYRSYLRRLANMADEHDFLFGAEACVADFAAYHPLWFTRTRTPAVADILQPTPSLLEWMERVSSVGHGRFEPLGSADAIEVARRADPEPPGHNLLVDSAFQDDHGIPLGSRVTIAAESFGPEATEGELIAATRTHYSLRRDDPRAGTVPCPFPAHRVRPEEGRNRMIDDFKGKTAVLTGAGSGFGLECARIGAQLGMNLVLVDVQQDALDRAQAEIEQAGAQVLARRVDVSRAAEMEALAQAVQQRFGAPHFVFNNAGVGAGGLLWENSVADWEWVLGVNLWGVVHGVRLFTPMMLAAAKADPHWRGHIVNTASMAGLLTPPNMGIYNVSKHAVVAPRPRRCTRTCAWSPTRSAPACCARTSCRPASTRASATGPANWRRPGRPGAS